MKRFQEAVLLVCAAVSLRATPLFVPGDLIWASQATALIYEISTATSGQNLSNKSPIATVGSMQLGQMAFSLDAQTAYMTVWGTNSVVAISNTGQVTTFASGINSPTGLIRTSTGKLLVADYYDGTIYDITAGGDFSHATAYATGLVNPRNFVDTGSGILIADQGNGTVKNIGNGGNLSGVAAYASGISSPVALAWYNNHLYASTIEAVAIFDITAGKPAAVYASGRDFFSLAVANGKLYSGTSSEDGYPSYNGIWDISVSGTGYLNKPALASYAPAMGNSLLSVVPDPIYLPPPPTGTTTTEQTPIPEPSTAFAGVALLVFCGFFRGTKNSRLK